jgi:hypothetical protein
VISWSRFDNATGAHHALEIETTVPATTAHAPRGLEGSEYVAVTVKSLHPDRPTWAEPVRAYFRREGTGWRTVGLERAPERFPLPRSKTVAAVAANSPIRRALIASAIAIRLQT